MEQFKAFLEQFHTTGVSDAYRFLGCHAQNRDGVDGFVFRTWAPQAQSVRVTGDFNFWNEEDLPMQPVGCGVWEAFSRFAQPGQRYKLCIKTKDGRTVYKTDPYGNRCGVLPDTASIIEAEGGFVWHDGLYRARRRKEKILNRPVNIYEVHAGSWKRHEDGSVLSFRELAQQLVPYVKDMGYTHIELMPVMEYPYDPSWGYQITCYYAPTHRYGAPEDLKYFIDEAHKAGIGVILDWVPAHFPKDANGLYEFDGTCCYELSDPTMNEHPDWTTRIYDYGKPEVRSFLISNACYWISQFHADGIRVDAVASMLYLDYNRPNYKPNRFGGRENLEAIDFLRQLNAAAFQTEPAVMMIAEESTAFPLITKPDYDGGLGFLFKWNMGWMNDMLQYMSLDPLYRKGDHNALTFSMTYAFSENFILPLSHDEVVHGKCSLIGKMPGNYDDKFNNLRVLYAYQMAHPGKKLNFMGSEFAQFIEWNFKQGLDWLLLDYEKHRKMQQFVKTLNRFYLENRELWEVDTGWDGYEWIEPDDRDRSVIAFRRKDRKGRELVVVCNFCPVLRENYRLGLPKQGWYVPVLNTDDEAFGGYGFAPETVRTEKKPSHGQAQSGLFRVPPMSVCFYRYHRARPQTKP
ncbi:MAG: 1,4-alpha-glucan branching protein GlgB [Oscillospiraceae bacterium]|nr:1,4-alpha-glucan branching protein GlgB [Oscillospiraceae bacterium]